MKICSTCGSVNSSDSKFCRKCGVPLATVSQPVRVKPAAKPPSPIKPAKPVKSTKPSPQKAPVLEPIPQMDVEEPLGPVEPETRKPNTPTVIEGPVSWRPPQKGISIKPGARPSQKSQQKPQPPLQEIDAEPEAQGPALIPIRPRPVDEMSITEKLSFYQPPVKTPPAQKTTSKDAPPAQAKGQQKARLIPLSQIAPQTPEGEEEESSEEEAPAPKPRSRAETKPHRSVAQKKAPSTDASSTALLQVMSDAMHTLSQQLGLNAPAQKKKIAQPVPPPAAEELEPQTMNDILVDLGRLDPNIEASAIIQQNGTILAAAMSRKVNDNLFSVIAGTLSNISRDVIQAMDAGKLKFTAIHGTQGILFLAPLFAEMYLLVYTNPLSRPGVINVATHRVKAYVMKYFGVKEGDAETALASKR